MKPLVNLCALIALCGVSGAAEKKKPADTPFKPGVYAASVKVYRFKDGQFERWRRPRSVFGGTAKVLTDAGSYSVTGNEIRLTFENGEKETWTFRIHEGKPSLWDVPTFALWENMGKVSSSGIMYWTKSTPEKLIRDFPPNVIHE